MSLRLRVLAGRQPVTRTGPPGKRMRKSHVVAVGSGVVIAAERPLAQDEKPPAVDAVVVPKR